LGLGDVTLDLRREAPLVDALREGVGVQAQLRGVEQQIGTPESGLPLEEAIVIRPVLPLGARAAGRLVRGPGQGMTREGPILEDKPDATVVLLQDRRQRPLDRPAVWSLVVRELDDRHWRVPGTLDHALVHGQLDLRRRVDRAASDHQQREQDRPQRGDVHSRRPVGG
jgi:hypothetical protein